MLNDVQHQTYSVRLPVTLRQKLQRLAEAQDRKAADVIRRLIKEAYADLESQQEQETG
jgi:predicted DNA-binding protein